MTGGVNMGVSVDGLEGVGIAVLIAEVLVVMEVKVGTMVEFETSKYEVW